MWIRVPGIGGSILLEVEDPGLRDRHRRILERPLDQQAGEVDADEGHHQRRDDLVRPVARLQHRGDDRPDGTGRSGHQEEEQHREPQRQVVRQRRPVACDHRRGEQELAVVAEVPDVRPEDDRQAGADQEQTAPS